MNIKSFQDWYSISHLDVASQGGATLFEKLVEFSFIFLPLCRYASLYHVLKSVYPEHDWKPWLFSKSSDKLWEDPKTVQEAGISLISSNMFSSMGYE